MFIGRIDAEAETLILWLPDAKSWLLGKDPDAGKTGGRRRSGQQRIKWLDGITNSVDMSLYEVREIVKDREAWHAAFCAVAKSWTWLNDNNNNALKHKDSCVSSLEIPVHLDWKG